MKKYNIACPIRKVNPYKKIAKTTAENRVIKNILKRNFKQEIPLKVLLTDITYLPYYNGMAYQGVHYTSYKFQNLLKLKNIGQSMFRRGNCWDNSPQESFFGHMKDDIDYKICKTFD